jgi:hypothetical protein
MRENAAIAQPGGDQPSPSSSADPSLERQLSPRLLDHFASLTDPRVDRTKRHCLMDILVIAIGAVICGADGWTEIEA